MNIINNKYEILTPSGWSDFAGIKQSNSNQIYTLICSGGEKIRTTNNHRIKTIFGYVEVEKLNIGDTLLLINNKKTVLKSIEYSTKHNFVYDILEVNNNHEYYTNDFISHNCNFLGSANTLIEPKFFNTLAIKTELESHSSNNLRVFELPQPDRQYVIIADVAEGVGEDSSTFHIIDMSNSANAKFNIVATFESNLEKPNVFHIRLANFGMQYNEALIIVESNTFGHEVLSNLNYDTEYENILIDEKSNFGIKMTKKTKRLGCSYFKDLIENQNLEINDFNTIEEISKFIKYPNGTYAAEKNAHDDLVTPLLLFSYFINDMYLTEMYFEISDLGKVINKTNIDQIESAIMPFGFINNGVDDFGIF